MVAIQLLPACLPACACLPAWACLPWGLNFTVKRNSIGISQVMKQLQEQLDAQQKELAAFQEKYKIRIGQPGVDDQDDVGQGQGAAAASGKKQGGGGGSSSSSSKPAGDKDTKKSRAGVLI